MAEYVELSTGHKVEIRRVSPLLLRKMDQQYPRPKPPKVPVDYGDGEVRQEENPSAPEYLQALADFFEEREIRWRKLLFGRGVVCEIDQNALDQLRRDMAAMGVDLEEDDKIAYVSYLLIGSDEDTTKLTRAIRGISVPDEEEIASAAESFRSEVPES